MRTLRGVMLAWAALLCLPGPVAAGEQVGGYYKNDRWGFKVKTPRDWTAVAMGAQEEWIASKHISKRELSAKNGAWYWRRRPEMWVIGFPHERQDERGAVKKQRKGETVVSFKNPYKDYKEFIKRHREFTGGGFYFSKEEETERRGVKVTQYEIKVEKNTETPFRMVVWVYHFDDIDFAIQFKILEDYYESYKAMTRVCLKSFKRIKQKKALPGAVTTGIDKIHEEVDESKLTPEQLRKHRQDLFDRTLRKELNALPKGWYQVKSKHYVGIANIDRKYVKRTLNHAEGIRAYLEKNISGIGDDYVPPCIIRFFGSSAEESAFREGTGGGYWSSSQQILVTKRQGMSRDWEYEWMSDRLTDQWLNSKNSNLGWNMPWWIRTGLGQHMKFARVKGKRVEFDLDAWDNSTMRTMLKKGTAIPLKKMFMGETVKYVWGHNLQAGSVVGWLLGPGNRGKTKNALTNYLKAMVAAIEEAEDEYKKGKDAFEAALKKRAEGLAARQAEEGEEAEEDEEGDAGEEEGFKRNVEALSEALKKKRASIVRRSFEAGFGHLTDKDWRRLDKVWQRYAK
ncbi:MAG: hypothetical protein O7C98_04830 [Planctomycetota bacterium]|nr:hypothetical protein [Planctomycetota bacterium]